MPKSEFFRFGIVSEPVTHFTTSVETNEEDGENGVCCEAKETASVDSFRQTSIRPDASLTQTLLIRQLPPRVSFLF